MRILNLALLVCILLAPAWAADKKTPPAEPGITREQADAILNELRQIRQLLEKQAARPAAPAPARQADNDVPAKLKLENANWLGSKDAPVTMVEYTDYQCTFCQRFHIVTFPEIRKRYIDTGKVRFLSRDFPLDFHSNAFKAAEAARCAGEQDQFWKMRDLLVTDPTRLTENDLLVRAESLGLKMEPFKTCLSSGKFREDIQKQMAEAGLAGVSGTPSFIIGRSSPDGVDGTLVIGAQPLAVFEAKLQELGAK